MIAPNMDITIEVYGEPLFLPSRPATALTLIVNELVQNALEHAFNGRSKGVIEVSLGHAPEELIIVVRDDGTGLPPNYKPGLGLEIAQALVTDDLRGGMKFHQLPAGGTEVSIRIPRTVEDDILS
jgi:two-component sensor histidine kinase